MKRPHAETMKKILLSTSIGFFIFVEFFGFLLVPRPAYAAGIPVVVTESVPAKTDNVLEQVGEALLSAALGSVVQAASYFMRKLAYDTATLIASGGKGQGALAFQEGVGEYFARLGEDTAAEAIDSLGEGLGIDLCTPPSANFMVGLKIGLNRFYGVGGPQPNCTWRELSEAWKAGADNDFGLGSAANFANSLSVEQSDFGIALGSMARIGELKATAEITAQVERLVGQGFKPVTNLISGNIKTPASIVQEETKTLTAKHQGELNAEQIAGIYGAGLKQILPMTASVFLNTLVSSLLDRALSDGILPDPKEPDPLNFFASTFVNNRRAVQKAFNFLFTAVPTKSETVFDVVAEFSACPDSPGLNNCVMDVDFRQVLDRAHIGEPITVGQALEEGLLHRDWPLISPRREADNTNITKCYLNKYCYSNLQKMRKVRILPLGFEIAALRSDPDQPWTLGDVVDGFDDCTLSGAGEVIPNPKKPFCHLIDPNWIIRAPEARCEARVIGPELVTPDAPQRREECADISTCITEGANGECLDSYYSYCTKEKNVWRFGDDVQMCDEQFATCKTYSKSSGEIVSYLARTLDFGECRADNIGCRAYSLEESGGDWISSATDDPAFTFAKAGRNQSIYFSDNINLQGANCPASADGCNAFYEVDQNDDGTYVRTNNLAYLKKAPAYLGCYDTNLATPEIDWPTTKQSVINDLSDNPACDAYAQVCVEEEIGCQGYTPLAGGGPEVPGIVGNNACDATCVGYDAFQQEASSFEPTVYPLYFIPSDAETAMAEGGEICTEQYAGCDEFTNLDTLAAGGESVEYYTKIKYCEKPIEENGNIINVKTFYSWEGSASEGFVLRVHRLRPVETIDLSYVSTLGLNFLEGDTAGSVFSVGSPMYADDTSSQLQSYYDTCNEAVYTEGINNPGANTGVPDCRAFYDANNNIYYRLLSKTITVSEECHPLRKTEAQLFVDTNLNQTLCEQKGGLFENGSCQRCYGGGRYIEADGGGSCVYNAMTGENESLSCPAEALGCRAYTGNAGDNIFTLFVDNFEPFDAQDQGALNEAKAEWPDTTNIASESTIVSQYSLEINQASAARTIEAGALEPGQWYELTFWARGVSQNLRIALEQNGNRWEFTKDSLTGGDALVGIADAWQQYNVGPVQFQGDAAAATMLVFERTLASGGSGPYFVDNVQLDRVRDHMYLIKDSWKQLVPYGDEFVFADVPIACDANPTDAFPGIALGCRAYADRSGDTVNTVGFETLCREEAIGCTPLVDTFNTVTTDNEEELHAFNVLCSLGTIVSAGTPCSIDENEDWTCTVTPGKSSCYVDEVWAADVAELESLSNASIDESTIIVPADTPTDNPIFLTNIPEYRCNSQYQGCLRVGLEDQVLPGADNTSYSYTDRYVLNNPDTYVGDGGILCRPDLVGCERFQSGNVISYFKDPKITGGQFCQYREDVETDDGVFSGWFIEGVGECSDTGSLCRSNSECSAGAVCENVGEVACYPDYFVGTGEYGLWSNGTINYEGFVGTCPIEQNACTELVDPADSTAVHPDGQPYYVIFDEEITAQVGLCEGEASLEEGCVLFDKTDSPNKLYDSGLTYAASENARKNNLPSRVSPESSAENDANIIINVNRDRQCSEWLACKTALAQSNDRGGKDNLCYEYRACNGLSGGECDSWIPRDAATDTFLSYNTYITRDTSWYGEEYTGFSLYNHYSVNNLIYLTVAPEDETEDAQSYMAYKVPPTFFENAEDGEDVDCAIPGGFEEDWTACGFDQGGRCFDGNCIYPIDGPFSPTANADNLSVVTADLGPGGLCKAFPEAGSPFPREIVVEPSFLGGEPDARVDFIRKKSLFSGANACQDGNCSCEYQKVEYANGVTDYWSLATLNKKALPQKGICTGGENAGAACEEDSACPNGTCSLISNKETHIGLYGYCLEFDRSRPVNGNPDEFACLTWLPIDVSASGKDNYNFDVRAGFNRADDAVEEQEGVYCINSTDISAPYDSQELQPGVDAETIRDGFRIDWWYEPGSTQGGFSLDVNFMISCFAQAMLSNTATSLCQPFDNVNNFYTIMHYWVTAADSYIGDPQLFTGGTIRENFDENLIVLRTEQSMTTLKKFGNYDREKTVEEATYGTANQVQDHSADLKPKIVPYNFLPRVRAFNINPWACGEGCTNLGEAYQTAGVIHHPPRQWIPQEYGSSSAAELSVSVEGYHYDSPSSEVNVDDNWSISGLALAPGPYYSFDNMDSALYRSPFEAAMNVADLDRVYFVPTAYPGGMQEQNPVWLDDQIYIDFTLLNNTKGSAADRIVDRYKSSDEETGDNDNEKDGKNCAMDIRFVNPACAKQHDAKVLTYLLTDKDNPSLISQYGNLKTNNPDLTRNRIDKRYVLLWYEASKSQHASLSWIKYIEDENGFSDPFSDDVKCQLGVNSKWFAIAMDFNKNGEFLGYVSRWCSGNPGDNDINQDDVTENGVNMAVVAKLNNSCTEYHLAYDQSDEDKAWTNRVWENSEHTLGTPLSAFKKIADPFRPYGGTDLSALDLVAGNDVKLRGNPMPSDALIEGTTDIDPDVYPFGKPYACASPLLGGFVSGSGEGTCPGVNGTIVFGLQDFRQLFAMSFKIVKRKPDWTGDNTDWIELTNGQVGGHEDLSDGQVGDGLLPPQIYSLNPATCFGEGTCSAGESNNITVNAKNGTTKDYNGDGVPDEDPDDSGSPDIHIAKGSFAAVVQFFAFADDNKMPIRRVMVDWGDGSQATNQGKEGMYKNRKPFCDPFDASGAPEVGYCGTSSNAAPSLLTCSEDSDCPVDSGQVCLRFDGDNPLPDDNFGDRDRFDITRFGNSSRACVEDFFEFQHGYFCESDSPARFEVGVAAAQGLITGDDQLRLLAQGVEANDVVCVYKPKVQVKDNWGWCNGSCNGVGNTGCYSALSVGGECDPSESEPWTEYTGSIIVIPST